MCKVVAKLVIGRKEWELNSTKITFYRNTQTTGKPCSLTMGGVVTVKFTPKGYEDDILKWMFADRMNNNNVEYPYSLYTLKKAEIVFYEEDYNNGIILFRYKLSDCTVIKYRESFCNIKGMETTLMLSSAIQYYKNNGVLLLKDWHENWEPPQPYRTPVIAFK